jgi:diacylglycerol kinase family enzyme
VKSRFGGSGRSRSKIAAAIAVVVSIPFFVSTFAASVTVGSGALTFGQGSQQAVACDSQVYVALAQEWKSAPTESDPTAGFFRVKSVTVSGLDLVACQRTKLRLRLINMQGQEIVLGTSNSTVLQMSIPTSAAPESSSDPAALALGYLTGGGDVVSGVMYASINMSTGGTSIYDGSTLSANSSDVTFYLDPTQQNINIDGAIVGRTTVESVNNPAAMAG